MCHTLTQIRMCCQVFCTMCTVKMDVFNILQFYGLCFIGALILYRVNRLQSNLEINYISGLHIELIIQFLFYIKLK